MITSSTWLYTLTRRLVSGTCPLLTLHTTECFAASTPTFGVAPGVGGQEMKLNPEKWLAERAARSWTAGIGKRNDLRGKLRSTPRRHCIWTRLDFFFILCHQAAGSYDHDGDDYEDWGSLLVVIKDTNPQHIPLCTLYSCHCTFSSQARNLITKPFHPLWMLSVL